MGRRKGSVGKRSVSITRPRPDVVVVDYVASTLRATSVTIVLDLARSAATAVVGALPTAERAARSAFELATEGAELTLVAAELIPAAIDRPFAPGEHPHTPTDDLVGKRVQYVYSRQIRAPVDLLVRLRIVNRILSVSSHNKGLERFSYEKTITNYSRRCLKLRFLSFYFWYSSIEVFGVRKGVETMVHNMLGHYDKDKLSYSKDIRPNIQFCNAGRKTNF